MGVKSRKLIFAFSLCCLVLAVWGAPAGVFGMDQFDDRLEPVVAEEVFAKLQAADQVSVLILLKERDDPFLVPESATAEKLANFFSRQRIKTLQNEFVAMVAAAGLTGDFKLVRRFDHVPLLTGRINSRALAALQRNPHVARVESDRVMRASLAESGPLVGSPLAQVAGFSGDGVAVAVLDTGIDTDHPLLQDSLVWEECFLSDGGCPVTGGDRASGPGSAEDDASHGTHVAGIITSSDLVNQGVAPGAKIVALKVLDAQGEGNLSDILAAADWVISNKDLYGIKVINLSLGSETTYEGCCDEVNISATAVVNAVRNAGITIVAASGNDAKTAELSMPACLSAVISVGAVYDSDVGSRSWSTPCQDQTTEADQVVCFSNASAELDLLAPGSVIISTVPGSGTAEKSGTSMACPHTAAAAALLYGVAPWITPDEVENVLVETGLDVFDDRNDMTFPRLDVAAALDFYQLVLAADIDGDGYTYGEEMAVGSDPDDARVPAAYPGLFGDLDEDGDVDGADLSQYARVSRPSAGKSWYLESADVNSDGLINDFDNRFFAVFYARRAADAVYDVRADFDTDGDVDHLDLFVIIRAFDSLVGEPDYNPEVDITQDGRVDEDDLWIVGEAFMRSELE